MSIRNKKKQRTLLYYWTTRYLIVLVAGLAIVGIISTVWIKQSTLDKRLDLMKVMADEVADRVVSGERGAINVAPAIKNAIENRQKVFAFNKPLQVMIVNPEGKVIFTADPMPARGKGWIPTSLLENSDSRQRMTIKNQELYLVKSPIQVDNNTVGWVILGQTKDELIKVQREYGLLAVLLLSIGILGWFVIYMLTKRLARPVQQVADAARAVEAGRYDITLPEDPSEKELSELVSSFQEMTSRLKQLESLRTELLASVTHEFKTPVTSISGLLQAIKDGVVDGDDAQEFIAISYDETQRLKQMVEDLLDFNAFVTGSMKVNEEDRDLYKLVDEIIHQWSLAHKQAWVQLKVQTKEMGIRVLVDPHRLYQIMTNLLNNAQQAIVKEGTITVEVKDKGKYASIIIQDTGSGISKEDQAFIFERFYRGEQKKNNWRGLGIGLSYSKMLAQSQSGDLHLIETSPKGTTFEVEVRKT